MNIPTSFFMWSMAALPVIVLIVLMMKFQWGATKAAPVGLLITVVTGLALYKADLMLILCESGKGLWNAMTIILIVWTAILLYQVGFQAGAFTVIRDGMRRLLPNELLLIIAIGWIFGSFLQGITGFGVPVAVCTPLLIGIGVQPVWAVIISLLGQAWGNTFGTLGAAWDALAMSAGLTQGSTDYLCAAFWTAAFLYIWNIFTGLAICWFYGRKEALKKGMAGVLILSAIQGGGELLLSQVNTTVSCFIPSCISLAAVLLLGRTKIYRESWSVEGSSIMEQSPAMEQRGPEATEEQKKEKKNMTLVQAFIPYFSLSALTLVVLLIKPVNRILSQISVGFAFPQTETGYGHVNAATDCFSPITPFTHASMLLLVSALIGMLYYRKKGWMEKEKMRNAFSKSISMTIPSGMAVICLVIMSKIMDGTGQTIVLANGITEAMGSVYVLLAPFVGLLGTFMTGSNMSSNILFGGFQMATATLLGVSAPALLGAQSVGGAIGSVISPSKIILGTTTANILGNEGKIMKKLLLVTLPMIILIGVILFAAVCLW